MAAKKATASNNPRLERVIERLEERVDQLTARVARLESESAPQPAASSSLPSVPIFEFKAPEPLAPQPVPVLAPDPRIAPALDRMKALSRKFRSLKGNDPMWVNGWLSQLDSMKGLLQAEEPDVDAVLRAIRAIEDLIG